MASARAVHRLVHDGDAGDAGPFQLDGVAQTARTARASTTEAGDRDGDLRDQLLPVRRIGRHRHAGLPHEHDVARTTDRRQLAVDGAQDPSLSPSPFDTTPTTAPSSDARRAPPGPARDSGIGPLVGSRPIRLTTAPPGRSGDDRLGDRPRQVREEHPGLRHAGPAGGHDQDALGLADAHRPLTFLRAAGTGSRGRRPSTSRRRRGSAGARGPSPA